MDLGYYRMTPWQRFIYKISKFFKNFGRGFVGFFGRIFRAIANFFVSIGRGFKEFGQNFWYGDALAGFMPMVIGMCYYVSGRWKKTPQKA